MGVKPVEATLDVGVDPLVFKTRGPEVDHLCVCMCACVCVHLCACVCVHLCPFVFICVCACTRNYVGCVCVYKLLSILRVHAYMHKSIHSYTHIKHTHTHTHTHTCRRSIRTHTPVDTFVCMCIYTHVCM
jgi:hypothetical protein